MEQVIAHNNPVLAQASDTVATMESDHLQSSLMEKPSAHDVQIKSDETHESDSHNQSPLILVKMPKI